jgi:hypothetical protein
MRFLNEGQWDRWCPAYTLFRISTVKTPAGHCPNCDTERNHV